MASFVGLAMNPNPPTDTATQGSGDRQWAMLHSSGLMMVSHGLQVPTDTPGQSGGSRSLGLKGSWSLPRWGWGSASYPGYQADSGRALVVTDWTPDNLSGYVLDTYGAIWPFGPATPYAATGPAGAPFGDLPPAATPIYKHFQMHSANSQAFGLGGFPSGFGWILSYDGVFYPGWPPGAAPTLQDPYLDILGTPGMTPINNSGVPGSNPTVDSAAIADFKVNPDNSGEYYVLFWSGRVYTGHAVGASATHSVTSAQPVGTSGNAYLLPHIDATTGNPDPFVAMHVNWGDSIIAITARGGLWGYNIGGTFPPFPAPPPWQDAASGGWQDIAIIPYRAPSHLYLMGGAGALWSSSITGTVTLSALATNGTHQTSTRPTLTWTYASQYSVPQKSYNVRVYPIAVTGQTGFTPGQNAGAVWISDRTSTAGTDRINVDLTNGAQYAVYLRVTSAAGTTTAWTTSGVSPLVFTMAIPLPAAPSSCTTTPSAGTYPNTFGSVSVAAGGSLPAGCVRQFQVSAENGSWEDVIGAASTASNPVTDLYPPTNVNLTYRVRNFKRVPGLVASAWTLSANTILPPSPNQPAFAWYLIDTQAAFGPARVQVHVRKWEAQTLEPRGEFQPLTRNAMVVTTAGVKGTVHNLSIVLKSKAEADALWSVLQVSGRPLLFETQYGYRWWVAPRPGTWAQQLVAPTAFARNVDVELLEVVRPS